ncbi:IclR family transcriptional regulator C-terminal domain-containing protein [Kribbella sp. NPDC050820]|uniref:IclR family transcriptional regulator domain-containing protein n=1 Tax=Kribbella sp. NPDC050820 TaxID=3155408 RepID=UPI0033F6D035
MTVVSCWASSSGTRHAPSPTTPCSTRRSTRSRGRGYATETEELSLSRACVAAPLRDRSGGVVGALSLSGPSSAVDLATREHELSRLVVETADAINSHLGHHGPADPQITAPPGRLDQRSRS